MANTKGWGCAMRGKTKKYASGGFVGAAGTNRGSWSGDGESLGITTGTKTGISATNKVDDSRMKTDKAKAPIVKPKPPAKKPMGMKPVAMPTPKPQARLAYEDMGAMFKREGTGTNWPGQGNVPTTRTAPGKESREPTSRAAPGKTDRER